MKKTLIISAALTAFSAAAIAQQAPASSVTLYGVVDANIAQSKTHAGAKVDGMDELPNPRGSRFGLRGSENLGGGMRAIFQLEAGLSAKDGTTTANNQLFNRHAWVGMAGGFGELTVGRQDSLHRTMNLNNFNDVSTEGELSVTTSNSGLQLMQNFGSRLNSAVRYASPVMSGFQVRAQRAIGQRVTANTNGVMVSYSQGPLRLAATHEYYDGEGIAGIDRWNQVTTVGGQYNLGFATVALGYQTTDRLSASAATAPASAATLPKHSAYNIGVIYPATKDLSLRVQYTESKTKIPVVGTTPASTRDYERTGVSARYAFSPRTFGYAAYVDRKVDVPTAANNKNVVGVGISHAF